VVVVVELEEHQYLSPAALGDDASPQMTSTPRVIEMAAYQGAKRAIVNDWTMTSTPQT
jgi:hypothetical protein